MASEYLQAMYEDLLEPNLSTIFSTLRNTEQYWRRPKNDLNCMLLFQHYGLTTWFFTLSPSKWVWDNLDQYVRFPHGTLSCRDEGAPS